MDLKIKLADGELLHVRVDVTAEQWERRFRRALKRRKLLTVRRADGEILAINPFLVQFMRYGVEAKGHELRPFVNGTPSSSNGNGHEAPIAEPLAPLGVVKHSRAY